MRIGIATFTSKGEDLGLKIINNPFMINHEFIIYSKSTDKIRDWVRDRFSDSKLIVFIGALGLAIRLIASHIVSKDSDPAVIVCDELCKYVIPVLSGHIGGANEYANLLADYLGATPIITTATDINNKFAVDIWSKKNNCIVSNIENIKYVSSYILEGKKVAFSSDLPVTGTPPADIIFSGEDHNVGIMVSWNDNKKPYAITLNIIPKSLVIGVGCRKGIDVQKFEEFILGRLEAESISIKSIYAVASIDLKKNEEAILAFSLKYKIPFYTYSSGDLQNVHGDFSSSNFVKHITGVDNVCERAALLHSNGVLISKKTSFEGITCAIAQTDFNISF